MWFVDLHRLMHRVRREDRRLAAASKHQYAMARRMPRRCLARQLVRQLKGRIDQLCQPRVQAPPDAVLEYVVVDLEFPSLSAARIPEFALTPRKAVFRLRKRWHPASIDRTSTRLTSSHYFSPRI